MKKMLSFLLALLMVISLLPVMASAETGNTPEASSGGTGTKEPEKSAPIPVYYHDPNAHDYDGYGCNTKYHWKLCACGCKISVEPHVDPKDAKDDYCICGYHFSDDADLVVLWIDGCPGIKKFDKDTKEIRIVTKTNDSEATVELPEDLTLKSGENKFEIKVTSENQKVTKIYTVTVVK